VVVIALVELGPIPIVIVGIIVAIAKGLNPKSYHYVRNR